MKNRIISQMFDIRPVDEAGDLDWKKIEAVDVATKCVGDEPSNGERNFQAKNDQRKILLEQEKMRLEEKQRRVAEKIQYLQKQKDAEISVQRDQENRQKQQIMESEALARKEELRRIAQHNHQKQEAYERAVMIEREKRDQEMALWLEKERQEDLKAQKLRELALEARRKKAKQNWLRRNDGDSFSWSDIFSVENLPFRFKNSKPLLAFATVALVFFVGLGSVAYVNKGLGIKGKVLGASTEGMGNLNLALTDIKNQDFEGSSVQFEKALANFSEGSVQLESMGGILLDATRFVPFATKVASGKNALEAGKHFSAVGKSLNEIAKIASSLKNPIDSSQKSQASLLDFFSSAQKNMSDAKIELDAAQQNIDRIAINDLPIDKRDKFLLIKQNLPDLRLAVDTFLNNSYIFADLLGGNGPRKYLFLFQNNTEMRATGGFIGSYGLLDIANGHVKKFFVDGIFNPDGQLSERIVPPVPIQKISTNWSMHDSNWFADFPMSAKKAISFYEKTGGPTADGVITLTPTVMQKLLEITGPIEMPEYDVILDSENFIELTQYKVEVDYDKEENRPKKILSDLAPLVLEKLFSSRDLSAISKTAKAFLDGLAEKHILFYSENSELQKIISERGWSGEILSAPKDYISVINTNVNGFKTDAVVDEKIQHKSEIQADGSIVDTVSITRKHNGGDSQYEWLNKVNANYMRVYVPQGSKILEVSGQTIEKDSSPVDYDALGFTRDQDVVSQENSIVIDQNSGTRVYDESGKTVFANWTYVSPGESMTITYRYLLPFSLFKVSLGDGVQSDSYSLVAQKQSGSLGSEFSSEISYPSNYETKWNFPSELKNENNVFKDETKLDRDKYIGMLFVKK